MDFITTDTESYLIRLIDQEKSLNSNMRCLHFRISAMHERWLSHRTVFTDVLQEEMIGFNSIYALCEDGDIYLFDTALNNRLLKKIIGRLNQEFENNIIENFVDLYEVKFDDLKIKKTIERKLILINERKRQELIAIQEKKKQDLMNITIDKNEIDQMIKKRQNEKIIQIMVVEDDVFTHRLISKTIGETAEIHFCTDAGQAINKYTLVAPDIVFLDIGLPDVSGHDVVKKLLQIDTEVFVVMLSGNSDISNVKQALSNGAKGFTVKPFTKSKIWEYIQRSPHIINKIITEIK